MVSWDPFGVVGCSGGNSGAARSFFNLLRCARRLLGEFGSLSGLALLREVWRNPDGVEEVSGTSETSQEEEVEEDTKVINNKSTVSDRERDFGVAHIWGSKMLVSGSTTLTVPLWA